MKLKPVLCKHPLSFCYSTQQADLVPSGVSRLSWRVGSKFSGGSGETTKYKTFVELYLGIILYYILTISKLTKKSDAF